MKKLLLWLSLVCLVALPSLSEACQPYRNVMMDINGNIIAFGQITIYKAGTSTVATIYADANCTVSQVNPMATVADGTFQFWVADGYYDLIFAAADHIFSNVLSLPLFEPVLENMIPVSRYHDTDICTPVTGALANLGAVKVWLWINKPVTCGTSISVGPNVSFFIAGAGGITETGGASLSIGGKVIREPNVHVPVYSASITFDVLTGNIFEITPTNNSAFTINKPLHPSEAAEISISILNTTGGALGTLTWGVAGDFSMSSWTQPANNTIKTITFYNNGVRWVEKTRTGDIPYP